ncbi:hypothetical protein JZU46_05180 [bacterium]|jgi:hypothetical protein|nr:hypothetical protein [bacterium]
MDSVIGAKLQTFNAWGMVSVSNSTITVIISAVGENDTPLHRTLKAESRHTLPAGSALIAVSVETDNFRLQTHELGETDIATHPEVERVIARAVEWIRKSA